MGGVRCGSEHIDTYNFSCCLTKNYFNSRLLLPHSLNRILCAVMLCHWRYVCPNFPFFLNGPAARQKKKKKNKKIKNKKKYEATAVNSKIDLHPRDQYQVHVICVVSELTNLFAVHRYVVIDSVPSTWQQSVSCLVLVLPTNSYDVILLPSHYNVQCYWTASIQ